MSQGSKLAQEMTEQFVTIIDSLYLAQALTLHRSMLRHLDAFSLWIVCVDPSSFETLQALKLKNVFLINLREHEPSLYRQAKLNRSSGEYCWTLNPLAPQLVFKHANDIGRLTYLDADLWFTANPKILFEEFEGSQKSILITEHAYLDQYPSQNLSGRFCAQWITYSQTNYIEPVLWWEQQCLEWCYDRIEDGKLGDQKYLEEWPVLFPELIHIYSNPKAIMAPWNLGENKTPKDAFAHHFHGLRLQSNSQYVLKAHALPSDQSWEYLYLPYLNDLATSVALLEEKGQRSFAQITFFWDDHSLEKQQFFQKLLEESGQFKFGPIYPPKPPL